MSIPVPPAELAARVEEYGTLAYLVTISDGPRAHIVAVAVDWSGGELVVGAGRTTSANVTARPEVSLLWAAPDGGDYSLIVDGAGRVEGETVLIKPAKAVLHKTAREGARGPRCVPVLSRTE